MSRRNKSKSAAAPSQAMANQIAKSSGAEGAYAMVVATPQGPRRITASSKEVDSAIAAATATRERAPQGKHATVGSMTTIHEGRIVDDVGMYNKIRLARAINGQGGASRTGALFDGYGIGAGADIGDSANLSTFNFEFPVDSMEQPQSRRQELRYYRMAYDRDPIVGRGIDMHVELTLSKMILEKPKCSVQSFADYVFDWFEGWQQDINLFDVLLHGAREYWLSGEAFPFVEHKQDLSKYPLCPIAMTHGRRGRSRTPISDTKNPPIGGDEESLYAWRKNPKKSALARKWAAHAEDDTYGIFDLDGNLTVDLKDELRRVKGERKIVKAALASPGLTATKAKVAALRVASTSKTAGPGDDSPAPEPLMKGPLQSLKEKRDNALSPTDGPDAEGAEGAGADAAPGEGGGDLGGDLGLGGDAGGDIGLDSGSIGAPAPMGGGGGGLGGDLGLDGGPAAPPTDPETIELQRYLKLLEKKKELLTELLSLQEERLHEAELFSHIVNPDYMGPDAINLLPPDVVEIKRDPRFNSAPTVYYKPSAPQKESYLESSEITPEDKETLEAEGIIPLNDDPAEGSYVLHFARKKAQFEDHGRSVLQRCMRTIIYREKLRQVQTTLASRNMTPKTLIVAKDAPVAELDALRVHVDEAKADPDYTIVVNYEVQWNEIGSEGRILSLEAEWQHTSGEIAIGLGFTPELLAGEGFYSGDRIRIEMLNTTYVHFRDTLAELVEQKIFKPIAMRKGFYEIDDFGNPRWVYPKLNFSRLALRDSGDVYDMLYNLFIKNSVPVDVIYEFLNLDPETMRRKLEEDLFTVKDPKMSQALDSIYGAIADRLMQSTDVVDRIAKGLTLREKDVEEQEGAEGSGEGM